MNLNHDDADGSRHVALRTPEDAFKVLKLGLLEMSGGRLPEKTHERVALLFATISSLTLKTAMYIDAQHPNAPDELKARSADHAIKLLLAAATTMALELFDYDFDEAMSSEYSPPFSAN
jgi:hypothetical protein